MKPAIDLKMTENYERKTKTVQQEIMDVGGTLSHMLKGQISDEVQNDIKQYFQHNEYGEAMGLLQFVVSEDQTLLTDETTELVDLILTKMREVESLYN